MEENKQLSAKQIGRNVIIIIEGAKFSKKTIDNEEVKSIKLKIDLYNKKPTPARLKELIKIFNPNVEKEEKLKQEEKGLKKIIKKETKKEAETSKKEIALRKKQNLDLITKVKGFYKKAKIKDNVSSFLVVNKTGHLAMKNCETINMPDLLVKRIEDFITRQTEIKSLLNFWSLCLLNPNHIARTKLFDYLVDNGLTITPSGYFVTYRMVKTVPNEEYFTDAHTKTMKYYPKTVCAIPRTECDEDGSRDCSRGLHTGTPLFIGIKASKKVTGDTKDILGDGYEITTKTLTPQSFGTGYDSPREQKFDNSFGNQAIICLINPMHVVSIPDSNTRKMRSCEFYFAKLTTAEEVIDMIEKDYLLFDADYQNFELKQLQEMLKDKDLKAYISEKSETGAKIAKLTKLLDKKRDELKLANDVVNTELDLASFKAIVKQRQVILK